MTLLQLSNINKHYKSYRKPIDRLKEIILKKPYHHSNQVLNDLSFSLNRGEAVAILGRNGAGKSTLLKILLGITLPDSGSLQIQGKITGLLELGSGFDEELSGIDNIQTNGLLIGMSSREIAQKKPAIIEFSELGDYINQPVRTYSSGMLMRLAFSIAIFADPDCFIVDEALAVGDASFQQKCIKKIAQFRKAGGALLFVSHDLNAVKMICERALVLDQGKLKFNGSTAAAVNYYNRLISKDSQAIPNHPSNGSTNSPANNLVDSLAMPSFGNNQAQITSAQLYQTDSHSQIITSGSRVTLKVSMQASQILNNVVLGFLIKDRFGQDIYGTNSHHLQQSINLNPAHSTSATFNLTMLLSPASYTLTLALHAGANHLDQCYFWSDNYLQFDIAGTKTHLFTGICSLPTQLEITTNQT